MKTETKILGIILILTAVLLVGGIYFLSRNQTSSYDTSLSVDVLDIDYSKGQKIGSDSAKVKLAEFSDFQCPACAAVEPFLEQARLKYADNLQLIYFQLPLPQHNHGMEAAIFAEAAGEQGKFWDVHDKLFATQTQWSTLSDINPFFLDIAKQLNLDENKLKAAESSDTVKSRIDNAVLEATRVGITSTPTFFLNGKKLKLQKFEDLDIAVAKELKK